MSDLDMFPDDAGAKSAGVSQPARDAEGELADSKAQVRHSALWAAYGDALGWISELTDSAGLKRRTAGAPLCRPIEWRRRIGGRAGISTLLPQGCYSDDSQLRLATARAIRPVGFDVEAFAKVELPIWLSYALGGGRATSAAASNLAKPKTPWYANAFKGWTMSGGSGAAMRIQPHVWATREPGNTEKFLPDVIRNAVCTHSHPSGLMGAVLHALALAHTMVTRRPPSPEDLLKATDVAAQLPDIIKQDTEVGDYWNTAFEQETGPFHKAWTQAIDKCRDAIRIASENPSNAVGVDRYADIVDRLRLRDPALRGSGMLTTIAAVGLIWCEEQPEEGLRIVANAVGTDTDTIATMAGAILGVIAQAEPPVEVLDADLFRSEADRLVEIAYGGKPQSHRYPDLMRWFAPRTRADALIRSKDGGLYVRGLGRAEEKGAPMASPKDNFSWQWLKLEWGQSLLIKRRSDLVDERSESIDLQRALDYIAKKIQDNESIGRALRRVVDKGTPGEIAAFTAILIDRIRQFGKTRQARGD